MDGITDPIEVSVVMAVHNGERYLREAIEGILNQKGVIFEFIIVNDGSTDRSLQIIDEFRKQEPRIVLLDKQNEGLTLSLIDGCRIARGKFIARQDADDVSLPGRLAKQAASLASMPQVSLVTCWTEYTGPGNEILKLAKGEEDTITATALLRSDNLENLRGVSHHGSTMFRKSDYIRAGGYRREFYFAQDLDLWLRLTDFGLLKFVPEILYRARFQPDGISGLYSDRQRLLAAIAIQLKQERARGAKEAELLKKAGEISASRGRASGKHSARGNYFLGKLLFDQGDRASIKYLRNAVASNPFHLKAWIILVGAICRFRCND